MKFEVSQDKHRVQEVLQRIEQKLKASDSLHLEEFEPSQTAVVFVDIIEGFVNIGSLSSNRALNILPYIKTLNENTKGFHKIYFADTHPENCTEFKTYPPHCIEHTKESELVSELVYDQEDENSLLIPKNCTNGFLTEQFQEWLKENPNVDQFIIVGLVTDICVMQFSLTLKAYFDQINKEVQLYVPIEGVETFEVEATDHMAQLMNLFALYNMQMNGIKILKS